MENRITSSKVALMVIFVLFIPVTACDSLRGKLTRSKAEELIKSTSNFNSKLVLMLDTEEGLTSDCNRALGRKPLWRAFHEMGLIRTNLRQISPGSAFSFALFSCDLVLTEQGEREASQWKKVKQYWGVEWEIPVATRQFVAVTGITGGEPDGAPVQADFTWRWASNDIGNKLRVADLQPHSSSAMFRRYDDGWRLVEIGISSGNSVGSYSYQTPLGVTLTPTQPAAVASTPTQPVEIASTLIQPAEVTSAPIQSVGNTQSVVPNNKYGAMAYSFSTGSCGYSYDYGSREEAERAALGSCKGPGCEVKFWFSNNCGAIAIGRLASDQQKIHIGWAWKDSKPAAENAALEKCRENGVGCQIGCSACNNAPKPN